MQRGPRPIAGDYPERYRSAVCLLTSTLASGAQSGYSALARLNDATQTTHDIVQVS
jgi:hypothetical protein